MKKLLVPLVLCLAVVAYFVATGDPAVEPIDTAHPAPDATPGQTDEMRGERSNARSAVAGEATDATPPTREEDLHKVLIRGRCLTTDKQPLGGCEIEIRSRAQRMSQRRHPEPPALATTRSRADGRFAVEVEAHRSHEVLVRARIPGHADLQGRLEIRDGAADTGDLFFPPGADLTGALVDEGGTPVPEFAIRISRRASGRQPAIRPDNWLRLVSDATGAVQTPGRIASGPWHLHPEDVGAKILEPQNVLEVTEGVATQHVKIVVRLADPKTMITGIVVDPEGKPVAQAVVHARDDTKWPVGYGYSKADGTFTVRCRKAPGGPVTLQVPRADGFEPLVSPQTHRWGETDVTLTLQRTSDLRVRVVEAGTKRPVERFQITWFQVFQPGSTTWQNRRLPPKTYAGGEAVVPGIPAGRARIVILPTDSRLAPCDPVEFEKGDGNETLEIALLARAQLRVRVTDRAGRPIAGSQVELLAPPDGQPVDTQTRTMNYQNLAQRVYSAKNTALVLDARPTNGSGLAVLGWSPGPRELTVRAVGPGHIPLARGGVVLTAQGGEVHLQVDGGATLQGSIGPREVLDGLRTADRARWRGLGPRIVLTFRGAPAAAPRQRTHTGPIEADGGFAFRGLAAGRWEVLFTSTRFTNGRGSNMGRKSLGFVTLGPGATQTVRYDISDLKAANLRGRVFLNGALATQRDVHVSRVTTDRSRVGTTMMLRTDDRGTFRAEGITPGRYTVSIQAGTDRRSPRLASPGTVEVPPGGDVVRDFQIASGSLQLEIRYADGQPTASRIVEIREATHGLRIVRTTDTAGRVAIQALATGSYAVALRKGEAPRKATPGLSRWGGKARPTFEKIGTVEVTVGSHGVTRLTAPKR